MRDGKPDLAAAVRRAAVGPIEVAEDQLSDRRQSVPSPGRQLLGAGPLAGEAPCPVIRQWCKIRARSARESEYGC